MEADLQELAEHVADQTRRQSSMEFSVKEQGHRTESIGNSFDNLQLQIKRCINQLAAVTNTMSSMATNLNALIISVNDLKKREDIREGKQVERTSIRVGSEVPFS